MHKQTEHRMRLIQHAQRFMRPITRLVALARLRPAGFVCIVDSRHPRGRREVLPQAACLNPEHMEALL